jgi:hypothetical protein
MRSHHAVWTKSMSNASEKDKDLQPFQFVSQREKKSHKQTNKRYNMDTWGSNASGRDGVLARFIQFNSLKSHA